MNKTGGQPERLSKLQKFILMAAYNKTIEIEPLNITPLAFQKCSQICKKWYFEYLVTADILLNFYNLEEEPIFQSWGDLKTVYADKKAANKARVATARAIKTLLERGYITRLDRYNAIVGSIPTKWGSQDFYCYTPDAIQLTPKGIEKAAELLKVC